MLSFVPSVLLTSALNVAVSTSAATDKVKTEEIVAMEIRSALNYQTEALKKGLDNLTKECIKAVRRLFFPLPNSLLFTSRHLLEFTPKRRLIRRLSSS